MMRKLLEFKEVSMFSEPVIIYPELAAVFGLYEAMFIYELDRGVKGISHIIHKGEEWIKRNNYQWLERLPYFSETRLKTVIRNLEKKGVVITDRTDYFSYPDNKIYRIDYVQMEKLILQQGYKW